MKFIAFLLDELILARQLLEENLVEAVSIVLELSLRFEAGAVD